MATSSASPQLTAIDPQLRTAVEQIALNDPIADGGAQIINAMKTFQSAHVATMAGLDGMVMWVKTQGGTISNLGEQLQMMTNAQNESQTTIKQLIKNQQDLNTVQSNQQSDLIDAIKKLAEGMSNTGSNQRDNNRSVLDSKSITNLKPCLLYTSPSPRD